MRLALLKQPYPFRKEYECAFIALMPPKGVEADPMAIGLAHTQEQLNVLAAIVHRVNCHDKLVEALEDCVAELEASRCSHIKNVIAARDALELAKGGSHD